MPRTKTTAINTEHILRRHFDEHALDVLGRIHARCVELAQTAEEEQEKAAPAGGLDAADEEAEDNGSVPMSTPRL